MDRAIPKDVISFEVEPPSEEEIREEEEADEDLKEGFAHMGTKSDAIHSMATRLFDASCSNGEMGDFMREVRDKMPDLYLPMLHAYLFGMHDT